MFSLESPYRGSSNEYTQYTVFSIEKKLTINYHKSADMGFSQGTKERIRDGRGKRAISVRAMYCVIPVQTLGSCGKKVQQLTVILPVHCFAIV